MTQLDYGPSTERQEGGWYRWPPNATTPALSKSIVAKSGPGRLYGFTVASTNVGAQFILVFDASALPANGTVPLFPLNVAAGAPVSAYYGSVGRWFDRGIVLANSTTQGSLTLGAADCLFDVQYE